MLNKLRLFTYLSAITMLSACATSTTSDNDNALETYNRAVYNFNTQFNKYILKPAAQGYRKITNAYTRERVNNALANIKEPISAVNHLLQGEPADSGKSIARFALNTTLGLAGTYDVAENGWNLEKNKTGFDDTLATWGVPDGPFFMLPFVGPSTPRAATGLLADSAVNPVYWTTIHDANVHDKIYYSYVAVNGIALYESKMDILDDLERNSVDFYSTMKSAYLQNRKGKSDDSDSVSYDFEMEEDEED